MTSKVGCKVAPAYSRLTDLSREPLLSVRPTRTAARTRSSGQALAELALVLPILALLLLGTIQFSFILAAQIGVTNAVREGARLAAVTTPTSTSIQANANAIEIYNGLTGANGLLARNVFAYSNANVVVTGTPDTSVCYYNFTDATTAPSVKVKVQVVYRHPIFLPLLDGLLDGIDGVSDGGLRIGASEELRVENDVLTTTTVTTNCNP